ncbi:hypothetical protein ABT168_04400 [Streptomyces sp. NPDC001793]|uniref:hypothetical protein n=1 Tax=Streptomyces sp. NPDC001793 TaxID=3154657 RepID=UPI00331C69F5
MKAWPLRAPNQNWNKDELFQRYRKIFLDGEFRYNVDTAQGMTVYIVGGVDFSKSPKHDMAKDRFQAEHRYLPRQTQTSVKTMTDNTDADGALLLGGNTDATDTSGGDKPGPTPTPTPTTPGKPSHDPTTPAPSTPPSTPPTTTGGSSGGQNPKDPGGDLAHTGFDTPVGLITGIAAALTAAGGGLVWWMRRRRTVKS